MSKIIFISGAASAASRLKGIELQAKAYFAAKGDEIDQIDVIDLPAEDLIRGKYDSPAILQANQKVEEADAVVVLTPVYKAAYTGALKTYLDLLPQKALKDKPVLPLVIGGTYGHLLVIEYALKPVLAALGATTILHGVYAVDTQVERTDDGFKLDNDLQKRLELAAAELGEKIKNKQFA